MKTKGKAWQLVVTVLLIVVFVYTAFFTYQPQYVSTTDFVFLSLTYIYSCHTGFRRLRQYVWQGHLIVRDDIVWQCLRRAE